MTVLTDKDTYKTKCDLCGKKLNPHFVIYVEDRDCYRRDDVVSVLASFVFCGPHCLKRYAEEYGKE